MMAKSNTQKKLGRPSGYTEIIAAEICDRIVQGESLASICRDDKMPSPSAVFRWLSDNPAFREEYARAQNRRAENLMSELLDLCDTPPKDNIEAQHRKLQVDTRKWVIAKMYPKKYGDKVENILSGEVKLEKITRTVVDPKASDA